MLTMVCLRLQPPLIARELTSVDMSDPTTLRERLTECMHSTGIKKAEIANVLKISRAAVSKWFDKENVAIEARHIFALADLFRIDARWLATGKGTKDLKPKDRMRIEDISARRLDLIRAYGTLSDEVRFPIRSPIETLATASSASYARWSSSQAALAAERDAAPKVRKTKKTAIE
jgi:transcriptional regulator with XRE-family HTH domain